MFVTICQTCSMLSSETLQITHGWLGFQEKSDILAVWPPWMNWKRDGGRERGRKRGRGREWERERVWYVFQFYLPIVQVDHPLHPQVIVLLQFYYNNKIYVHVHVHVVIVNYLRSQTFNFLSVPLDAKIVSLWGDHWTWNISSLCDSKEWSFILRLRMSHNATVWR